MAPDAPSGLVRATCDLAQELAAEGHEVHLLTDRYRGAAPVIEGVSVGRLTIPLASGSFRGAVPETARHNLMHAAAAYREVRRIHEQEHAVDAVLAPLWRSEGAVCLLDHRFPTIVSCMTSLQTLVEVDPSYRQLPDIEERLSLEHHALRRSRYLHGLTEAALSKTIDDYRLAPAITAVIGRGLRDRAGSSAAGSLDGRPRLLFVGRIERRKGVDTLLDAVRQLVEGGHPIDLKLAGPHVDKGIIARFERDSASRPRFAEAVQFVGPVSDAELMRLYADSDVVCVPSRYESHGVVLIEAMMFGKPIITCDGGGIGEVVDAGRNALVSPPEDPTALASSLQRVLEDAGLKADLGAAARATFERRFDARAIALQMQSFVTEVRAAHAAGPAPSTTVAAGLEQLIHDVCAIPRGDASTAATELLDPADGEPLRLVRSAAYATPAPRSRRAAQDTPRVTAAVLTYDRPELLKRTLDSLDSSAVQALVLDNGCAPAQAERVAAVCRGRGGVRLERSEANLGTAGGRDLAVRLTDSELVLFLDDDAELAPGAIDHLLADLDAHPAAGAVTATVVASDGLVMHSGGSLASDGRIVTFGLIGAGLEFARDELPPSGPAGWVPGTAVVVRRELLRAFPIDRRMAAAFEDSEWCYRISLERPDCFRRCREALAFHQFAPPSGSEASNGRRVELLAAVTHFYRRHGLVPGPWTFDAILPELRSPDGTVDVKSAKVLMELVATKGDQWMLQALDGGELDALLHGHRLGNELTRARADLDYARAELDRLTQVIAWRDQAIAAVVNGGWWRLRERLLPLIRLVGAVRRRLRRADERPVP